MTAVTWWIVCALMSMEPKSANQVAAVPSLGTYDPNMIDSIQFAGHSAVFIRAAGKVIAIDPWLEGNPSCPDDLKNPEALDLIVLTHGHGDHAGDTVRLQRQTGCMVVGIVELMALLVEEGVPEGKTVGMNKGGVWRFGDIEVGLTHAYHSSSFATSMRGSVYAGEPCGVAITVGDRCVYHAGDTALFSDLQLIGAKYRPSVALLPIGGHFTMEGPEAAEAARLLNVKTAIPIHYKTFPLLSQDAEGLRDGCRRYGIDVVELAPGESHLM